MKNEFTVYFLYDTSKTLLYIGKTISLRERIKQHISPPLVEKEPWRKEVNLDDILIYPCANKCDMDIYETYFINKYRPKYNRDKVYGVRASFKLPYLEGMKYVYNPTNMYTKEFLEYIDLRDSEDPDLELITKYEIDFPIFKKHYENQERKEGILIDRQVLNKMNSLSLKERLVIAERMNFTNTYIRLDNKTKLVKFK